MSITADPLTRPSATLSPAEDAFRAPGSSPSPPAEGGEGWGEEGRLACRCVGVSAVGCPSPQPSPRSFLTGRGSPVRALNTCTGGEGWAEGVQSIERDGRRRPLFGFPDRLRLNSTS